MKFYCNYISLILLCFFFCNLSKADSVNVEYTVEMPFPSDHYYFISIAVSDASSVTEDYVDLILPVWRTGRYVILNLSAGISDFAVEDKSGNGLRWEKRDKQTWRVFNNRADFTVKYRVYANEFNLRTRGLNSEKGFIDPTAVMMYPVPFREKPLSVRIVPYGDWHVTTGLDESSTGKNLFTAPNYDYLADCPILIGIQQDVKFLVEGKEYTVSYSGEGNYNTDTVTKDIKKIVETINGFWKTIPFEHFTFMVSMDVQDNAATEHINSTIINIHPLSFLNKEFYRGFLSTVSHEYFHAWNVKQLRPKGLIPYDYTKENYTEELWIAEGITSYYQNLFLVRSGLMSVDKYLERLSNNIRNYMERPGNFVQSLSEASYDAWIKHFNSTQNKYNAETDYYSKGGNVGMLLDLEIRNSSKNRYSLDDVMRKMYAEFPLSKGGYTNEDFIRISEELAGKDLKSFFNSYVFGVDTLDWNKYLNYAGLNVDVSYDAEKPFHGLSTREQQDRLYVTNIVPNSPAYFAGFDINDEIIALNGYRVRQSNFNNRISDMKDGDEITLTVMREDKLKEIKLTLKDQKQAKYKVEKIKDPDELQVRIFESMFF